MLGFFKRKTHVNIIQRESSKIRLHEFRSDKGLVGVAQKVHADPNFRLLLDVLRNEHPSHWGLPRMATMEQRAGVQGIVEGYNLALSNLEAMAVFRKTVELDEPTFEPAEQMKE